MSEEKVISLGRYSALFRVSKYEQKELTYPYKVIAEQIIFEVFDSEREEENFSIPAKSVAVNMGKSKATELRDALTELLEEEKEAQNEEAR